MHAARAPTWRRPWVVQGRRRVLAASICHASDTGGAPSSRLQDAEFEADRLLAAPRLQDGLEVHRLVHTTAGQHPGYLFQWRAFCDRQGMDWRSFASDEEEGMLAGAPDCRLKTRRTLMNLNYYVLIYY